MLAVACRRQSAMAQTRLPKGALADTIIQWGDYDQFNIQGPRAVRACQEACDRDARCRAWTYIKTTGACRLKHEPGLAVKNSCCASGYEQLSAPTPTDQAYVRQEYCAEYARLAVRAQDDNLRQALRPHRHPLDRQPIAITTPIACARRVWRSDDETASARARSSAARRAPTAAWTPSATTTSAPPWCKSRAPAPATARSIRAIRAGRRAPRP